MEQRRRGDRARTVAVVVYPGVEVLDVTGPLEVFHLASRTLSPDRRRSDGYRRLLVAERRGPVTTEGGVRLIADRELASLPAVDTFVVPGGFDREAMEAPSLLESVRRQAAGARRVVSVCTGAFVLAAAGLLEGRRVATHWGACGRLEARYPGLAVDRDALFVRDGKFHSSAGVTAGIDLALALVEEDLGRSLALAVARELVVFLRRPGGQSQFSVQLHAQVEADGDLEELVDWIRDHLAEDLSVERLARRRGVTPRHLNRLFRTQLGQPPGRFVEEIRVEQARNLLETTRQPVKVVAARCGFGAVETMRRAFLRSLGIPPSDYRRLHSVVA